MSYYDRTEPACMISVLGTDYRIFLDVPEGEDPSLKEFLGYCDETSHLIAVCARDAQSDLDDYAQLRKRIIRHELIHAFLFESGLGADSHWHADGHNHPEQTVDWFARQFPKLLEAFQQAGAL